MWEAATCAPPGCGLEKNTFFLFLFPSWNKYGPWATLMKAIPPDEGRTNWKKTPDNIMKQSCYRSSKHYMLKKLIPIPFKLLWFGDLGVFSFKSWITCTLSNHADSCCPSSYQVPQEKWKGFTIFLCEMLDRQVLMSNILGPKIQEWHLVYPVSKVRLPETCMHIILWFSG